MTNPNEIPNRIGMSVATEANSTTLEGLKARVRRVKLAVRLLLVLTVAAAALPFEPWNWVAAGVFGLAAFLTALFGGLEDKDLDQVESTLLSTLERRKTNTSNKGEG